MGRFLSSVQGFLSSPRAWNIALRTAHIAAMAVLLGGHFFDVPRERLLPCLWWTIGTGVALTIAETNFRPVWFHQVRGLATYAKIGLMCLVPYCWPYRVWILMSVVVIASVGSHMPARFRYYSVLRREVIRDTCGPGGERLDEE